MKINEGNIFEAMRLVLPEHRGAMAEWKGQRTRRTAPILSQDEVAAMEYVLSEAAQGRQRVRLTLFGQMTDEVLEGIPIRDGRLRLVTLDGIFTVDTQRLIGVERCGEEEEF